MFCILKGRVQNENGRFKGSRAARIRSAGVVAAKNKGILCWITSWSLQTGLFCYKLNRKRSRIILGEIL